MPPRPRTKSTITGKNQKLTNGSTIQDCQPRIDPKTARIWIWLGSLPTETADFASPYNEEETALEEVGSCEITPLRGNQNVWETTAKLRKAIEQSVMALEVSRISKKRKGRLVIDLTEEGDSDMSRGGLHIKKRTRADASGTQLCAFVKVEIDLTESDDD